MNAPEYKKLVESLRQCIEEQRNAPFVAISKMDCAYLAPRARLDEVWPRIVRELGLVDDGTGTQTYTLPGRGLTAGRLLMDIEARIARIDQATQVPLALHTPKSHEGVSPKDIKRRWKTWKKDDPSRAGTSLKSWARQELEKLHPDSDIARALRAWLEGSG